MKNSKINFSLVAIGIFALSIVFTSCKKYQEGPALSLRSKSARVANTWQVESYSINGVDYTSALKNLNYTETYTKDGAYSYSSSVESGAGKWEFNSDKTQIKRHGVSGQSSTDLVILKLKENAFWYYYMDGSDKEEIHLIPN